MITPQIRLKKKKSTEEQIIAEIHSLLHDSTGNRPYPLTITETAKVLEYHEMQYTDM